MSVETFRLYQTVAQSGVPYPEEPEYPHPEGNQVLEQEVEAAPNVWYVKEVVQPEYDEDLDDPSITSDDSGKRFFMYVISGGPVLGQYCQGRGRTMSYIPEGDHLLGWWHNGQLYGVPLAVNDIQSV